MKRALVTGSTAIQVGSDRTQIKMKMNASAAWKRVLDDLGYTTEWRAVTPGEDLRDYDITVAVLNKPNSIASSHVQGALWALGRAPRVIVALDDWQIRELISGLQTCARSKERTFRLRGGELDDRIKDEIMTTVRSLASGSWPYPIVAATLGTGDLKKIGMPAPLIGVDPTAYTHRYLPVPGPRFKMWNHASLLKSHPPDGCEWPVAEYGPQDRGLYGIGSIGADAKPRMTEQELADELCHVWGMFSPSRPFSGSSWWRARYLMAADAGCIMSADFAEAACLGEPYIFASDPRRVERLRIADLADLAQRQRDRLDEIAWPKERVLDTFRKVIKEYPMKQVQPPLSFALPVSGTTQKQMSKFRAEKAAAFQANKGQPETQFPLVVKKGGGMNGAPPNVEPGEKSGAYIRRLLKMTYSADSILERVHAQFPGSKATKSDIGFNKGILKKEGWQFGGAETYAPSGSVAYMPTVKPETKAQRAENSAASHQAIERVAAKIPKYAAPNSTTVPWDDTPKKVPVPNGQTASTQFPFAAVRGKIQSLRRIPNQDAKTFAIALIDILTLAVDLAEKLSKE